MNFKAVGHRLIIKPDPIEEVSKGGIVLPKPGHLDKQEKQATQTGTVMAIGPTAWTSAHLGFGEWGWEPWCKVGDRVYFAKYSGKMLTDEKTKEEFFIVNDEDIEAVILEEKQ